MTHPKETAGRFLDLHMRYLTAAQTETCPIAAAGFREMATKAKEIAEKIERLMK